MVASLARHGHRHVLILANRAATCRRLASAAAPPCLHSSLLRRFTPKLRSYGVRPGSVQLLWLQRWYYMRRLVLGGLNVFMLDTDVVFFHDPCAALPPPHGP